MHLKEYVSAVNPPLPNKLHNPLCLEKICPDFFAIFLMYITVTKVLNTDIIKLCLNEANRIERAKVICVC